jgi:short-subunit dehydrogenase
VRGDLTNTDVIRDLANLADIYHLDILINNAAAYLAKSIDSLLESEILELIDLDLVSPILLTARVWPVFKSNGGGFVININSLAGKDGGKNETIYCATKHGLAGFSKALQFDGTRDNVRVLDVYLGAMQTPMTVGRDNQNKFIHPYEVASTVLALCMDLKSIRMNEITLTRRTY